MISRRLIRLGMKTRPRNTQEQREEARRLRKTGLSLQKIAKLTGLSTPSVSRPCTGITPEETPISQYVFAVGFGDGPVEFDGVIKTDLMDHLEDAMRTFGHLPQEEFNAAYDAPATIDRTWAGWPWVLTVDHPLFGRIGCTDEEDVGSVVALMQHVRDHFGDRAKLRAGAPWPEPWPTNEHTTSISLSH
ncbi:hypothetical protein LAJ19_20565 (plasmid) [Deinococcus taeanensis]|uniref:hypothetical protein n=1 Tax=Deinococcus taeanensis TaxID=2737050 RepID=UPI001CDD0F78|nr:hypothetical protein [Deinococcus taeanensis]UBV45204.1 hypothetical protein LAJ19_20565 [Deinococcus taeanensis]